MQSQAENSTKGENAGKDYSMKYDYLEAVKADVVKYIREEIDLAEYEGRRDDLEEDLNDMLWTVDSVTGNGSGSYTFCRETAKGYVLEDAGTVKEALDEFDVDAETIADKFLSEDWEYFDVTARCYVLGSAINEVLDEYEADGAFDEVAEEEAPETLADIAASIAGAIVKGTEPEANTEPVRA